jgi:hypothetical protein
MPIVIDEILITVDVPNAAAAPGAPASTPSVTAAPVQDKQALIAECVERVLEVLAQRREP